MTHKAVIIRKTGLFVLGVATPWALQFAVGTAYRGNAPWEWLWSLSFAALWVLARPSYAAVSVTSFWTLYILCCFLVENFYYPSSRSEAVFNKHWIGMIMSVAMVLCLVTAIAGIAQAINASRKNTVVPH